MKYNVWSPNAQEFGRNRKGLPINKGEGKLWKLALPFN